MNCEIDVLRLKMIRQTESFLMRWLNDSSSAPAPPPPKSVARGGRGGNRLRTRRKYSVRFGSRQTCTSSHER
jgi:hypothetical protein